MADTVEVEGIVTTALPGAKFMVELNNGHKVLSYISGKIRINEIKIIVGDRVIVSLSPYDLTKGRIIKRFK